MSGVMEHCYEVGLRDRSYKLEMMHLGV